MLTFKLTHLTHCHVAIALLVCWHLASWAAGLCLPRLCSSFSQYSVWLSCLAIFCLTIGQNSFYYQPMRATYIHSVPKGYPTAFLSLNLLISDVLALYKSPGLCVRVRRSPYFSEDHRHVMGTDVNHWTQEGMSSSLKTLGANLLENTYSSIMLSLGLQFSWQTLRLSELYTKTVWTDSMYVYGEKATTGTSGGRELKGMEAIFIIYGLNSRNSKGSNSVRELFASPPLVIFIVSLTTGENHLQRWGLTVKPQGNGKSKISSFFFSK